MTQQIAHDQDSASHAGQSLNPELVRRLSAHIVASPHAGVLTTESPLTGAPLVSLPMSSVDDVARAVASARVAQEAWARTSLRERSAMALRLHDIILKRQEETLDLLQTETGKSRLHAYEEIADIALHARWYARTLNQHVGDKRRLGIVPILTHVREVRHPKGVVGIIAPWNYPLTLAVSDALPALLAGNAVVIKPDSQTVVTALWAAELFAEAGLPKDLLQIVVGPGSVVGTALIDSCDHIAFTGSTATGRVVAQRAAARLVAVSLELGGKNAAYVAEDANLDRAADALARDCYSNAGQLCVSIERVIVHQSVAAEFTTKFVNRVKALRLGGSLDYSNDVGSLINRGQVERIHQHVTQAVNAGAKVLAGGKPRPDLGPYFYEPTILADVSPDVECYANETFGPVVSIYPVASDAEAVALANGTEYGLNGAVWTKDIKRGRALARQFQTGTVAINEAFTATWGSVASPMGGRKQSGVGRRHGAEGILRYTEVQTVATQRVGLGILYNRGGKFFTSFFSGLLRVSRLVRFPWP